jgi:HEAT repeat protein
MRWIARAVLVVAAPATVLATLAVPAPRPVLADGDAAPSPPAAGPAKDPRRALPGATFSEELAHLLPYGSRGRADKAPTSSRLLVEAALRGLALGQAADGRFPAPKDRWAYDVGVTGLALAAFLGAGYGPGGEGPHADTVARGLKFLREQQDEQGCFGPRVVGHYVYGHAYATLALVEAAVMEGDRDLLAAAQRGLDFSAQARNPGYVWRYGLRPGDNDTSITGSMWASIHAAAVANAAAAAAGTPPPFGLDARLVDDVRAWVDKMTDDVGRVGYQTRGVGPARTSEMADTFPSELSEATTAIGVWIRLTSGDTPADRVVAAGLDLLSKLRPVTSTKGGGVDLYYWYYASQAMTFAKPADAKAWADALERSMRAFADPATGVISVADPWARDGGPAYATAVGALALEAPRRYPASVSLEDLGALTQAPTVEVALRARALRALALRRAPGVGKLALPALAAPDPVLRRAAAAALADAPPEPGSTRPLAAAAKDADEEVARHAARALGNLGAAAVPHLAPALSHASPAVRAAALDSAARIGAAAAPLADAARKALADPQAAVRVAAARAVAKVAGDAAAAVPVALAALQDADPAVQAAAVRALGDMGTAAAAAEPALLARATGGPRPARVDAAEALFAVRGRTRPELVPLLEALGAEDPAVRERAVRVLASFGVEAAPAAQGLGYALSDPVAAVRAKAVEAIVSLGREARDALPELESAAFHADAAFAKAASDAAAVADGTVRSPVPPSAPFADAAALRDAFAQAGTAPGAMAWASSSFRTAGPWLVDLVKDAEPFVRARAADALGDGARAAAAHAPALAAAAADPDPTVRASALRALLRVAPTAPAAAAALEGALRDADARVRSAALAWAATLPAATPASTAAVSAALKEGDPGRAAKALVAVERWKPAPTAELWADVLSVATTAATDYPRLSALASRAYGRSAMPSLASYEAIRAIVGGGRGEAAEAARDAVGAMARKNPFIAQRLLDEWFAPGADRRTLGDLFARAGEAVFDLVLGLVSKGGKQAKEAADSLEWFPTLIAPRAASICEAITKTDLANVVAPAFRKASGGYAALVACLKNAKPVVRKGAAMIIEVAPTETAAEQQYFVSALTAAKAREKEPFVLAAVDKALKALTPSPPPR